VRWDGSDSLGRPACSKFLLPKEAEEQVNKVRDPSAKQGFLNHQWRAMAEQAEWQLVGPPHSRHGNALKTQCALKRAALSALGPSPPGP
jgi:hypothetical protein